MDPATQPWTVEGELEGFARLAAGARRDPNRARRLIIRVAAVLFLIPFVIGTVSFMIRLVNAIF